MSSALAEPIELPAPEALARILSERLPAFRETAWTATTGSTNADLLARARGGVGGKPWLLGAHLQESGRGRAGRAWKNSVGAALMVSFAFDVHLPAASLPALSPLAGLAAGEALRALAGPAADALRVKWPNDVQWGEAKLAGLLVESLRNPGGAGASHTVVVGMGLNLRDADALSRALQRPIADWRSVAAATGAAAGAADIVCAVANRLHETLRELQAGGFEGFIERYRQIDALAGRAVNVIDQGQVVRQGIAQGIDAQGRLLVDGQPVMLGEISVRAQS